MKRVFLLSILIIVSISTKIAAQVSNIHGAWIEVNTVNDSMEVRLVLLSKPGSLMSMSQTISMFQVSANGTLTSLPAIQVDRIRTADTANHRYLVFAKRIPLQHTSTLFAWNACCRGNLINASSAAINESMIAYTSVYQGVVSEQPAESTRITSFPSMNYNRGVAQSVLLTWSNPAVNVTTQASVSAPLSSLSNGQFLVVSGSRLPASNELILNGNELTVFAPEAGNLAFNIRYQRTILLNGNTITLAQTEAAFQLNIDQATSIRNLLDQTEGENLEVYDMLGRLIFSTNKPEASQPSLQSGSYLFKRGNNFEKVHVF